MKTIYIIILVLLFGCKESNIQVENKTNIPLSKAMGDFNDSGFEKAIEPILFSFPKDHGPHNKFKTEWWYFTGNLISGENKMYGYQFTIFRTALTPDTTNSKSNWKSNQMYMGHFAVSDISNNKFYFDERFSRDGNNLAGANIEDKFRVWLEDWQIVQIEDSIFYDLPYIGISAEMENVKIDLQLKAAKNKILQGDNGLSQKGGGVGNASYYYSYTRLETKGTIRINNNTFEVDGDSWMDREWSTSALSIDQIGWDWFALQLNDNSELMYYQMRKKYGTPDTYSKGILVDQIGEKISFNKEDVKLNILDYWQSPLGNKYPSGWELYIPSIKLKLTILPKFKDQLMDVSVKYWEGSVEVSGNKNGIDIFGNGYVELTGY